MIFFLPILLSALKNDDPLTKDYINKFNKDSKFPNWTKKDVQKHFATFRKPPARHGSPHMVGTDDKEYDHLTHVFTGFTNPAHKLEPYKFSIYNTSKYFCTSWAMAVTSAMSLSLSIHSGKNINLSLQFIADCDLYGNVCAYRSQLSAYEPFYRRFIPQVDRWDEGEELTRTPPQNLTKEICDSHDGCYPGWNDCPRNRVLSGSCEPSDTNTNCPVYPLLNWKNMKSFLWEVGPITSMIYPNWDFMSYKKGVFIEERRSPSDNDVRQLDAYLCVTIIGWGQEAELKGVKGEKWWYVIPHLGKEFGALSDELFPDEDEREKILGYRDAGVRTGIARVARGYNTMDIESNAYGAIPFNFKPKPIRTPKMTRALKPTPTPFL